VDGLNAAVISCSISVCVTLRNFQCSITWQLFAVIALVCDVVGINVMSTSSTVLKKCAR
jgi:hypothetical protein